MIIQNIYIGSLLIKLVTIIKKNQQIRGDRKECLEETVQVQTDWAQEQVEH
jgi:hypothetical protein